MTYFPTNEYYPYPVSYPSVGTVLGSPQTGPTQLEQLIRLQSLDQLSPPAADLNMNGRRVSNIGPPQWNTDVPQATGSLLAATYYEPTVQVSYAISSTTGAAMDTTNLVTPAFKAISTAVLVELSAVPSIFAGSGAYQWGLFTATANQVINGTAQPSGTQVGYWTQCVAGSSAVQVGYTAKTSIRVSGLTVGNTYSFNWAHVVSVGTATGVTVVLCTTGTGSATEFGPAIMLVKSA